MWIKFAQIACITPQTSDDKIRMHWIVRDTHEVLGVFGILQGCHCIVMYVGGGGIPLKRFPFERETSTFDVFPGLIARTTCRGAKGAAGNFAGWTLKNWGISSWLKAFCDLP
jgi:hypothetical protein